MNPKWPLSLIYCNLSINGPNHNYVSNSILGQVTYQPYVFKEMNLFEDLYVAHLRDMSHYPWYNTKKETDFIVI